MKTKQTAIEKSVKSAVEGEFDIEKYMAGPVTEQDVVWEELEEIDDMEGIEAQLPQIEIIHSAQIFKMPDGTKQETITGVIVDHNRCNSYWKKSLKDGGQKGQPPECFALDAYKPSSNSKDIQSVKCGKTCPRYVYPSTCKKTRRLHIVLEGSILPHRLSISLMNLKGFDKFVTEEIKQRKLKLINVLVQFSLVEARSSSQILYSHVKYSVLKENGKPIELAKTKEQAVKLKEFRKGWLETMRGQDIESGEYLEENPEKFENGDAYDLTKHSHTPNEEEGKRRDQEMQEQLDFVRKMLGEKKATALKKTIVDQDFDAFDKILAEAQDQV